MQQGTSKRLDEIKEDAVSAVDQARKYPVIEAWMRMGSAVRGLIYALIGVLAIQLVFTGRGEITDQAGVLQKIASQPWGEIVLIVIVVGLVGYAMWMIALAVLNPFRNDDSWRGVPVRLGYLITGGSHCLLVIPAVNLLVGVRQQAVGGDEQIEQVASGILIQPWGPWAVGFVSAVLLLFGVISILVTWNHDFGQYFEQYKMSQEQKTWAIRMGKLGTTAMRVVLVLIGVMGLLAAVTLDAEKVGGFDAALTFLVQQPYGSWLLGMMALGLMAYAIYSFMGALWFRVKH